MVKFFRALPKTEVAVHRCSIKKTIPKSFKEFTGKHLCSSLFLNKLAGLLPTIFLSLLYRHFSLNFDKKYTALFSQSTSGRLLLLNILLFTESTSAPKCYTWPVVFQISFKHFQSNNRDCLLVAFLDFLDN